MDRPENRIFEAFNQEFEQELPNHHNSSKETFYKVSDSFAERTGKRPYSSHHSFNNARCRRGKTVSRKRTR